MVVNVHDKEATELPDDFLKGKWDVCFSLNGFLGEP